MLIKTEEGPALGAPAQDAMDGSIAPVIDLEAGTAGAATDVDVAAEPGSPTAAGAPKKIDIPDEVLFTEMVTAQVMSLKAFFEGEHSEEAKSGGGGAAMGKKVCCKSIAITFFLIGIAITLLSCGIYIALLPVQCCCPGGEHTKIIDKSLGFLAIIPWTIAKCFW
mmetsp:Transcript_19265/g.48190  ORF Transcript_19265/g.48190 Transcript_19265/m.48190 type:complete len:165 (-) Transcript_19265:560-1054(-)|eukprot:CAMPEP_0178991830 /NCGR_PEP_ID=MMETSP0795-20121207/5760_1 /TAXON_ID=88552 /ORGANISM="Amoebophrya sp., Strain Ameob2" /LENGTH=164 /DNA_ID=CAMNT_0020683611 /DNA_START=127 /DNA_END=621 /DNA_ORIENTATION=+